MVSQTPYLICISGCATGTSWICNANHKALELHDSYKIIIPYSFLYVNEIQHYSSDFNAVFVVVFVGFVLVFIWNVIFSLTFMVLTAILDLVKFFLLFQP